MATALCYHPLPSCLAHLAHCMGRFLAHLSWKWEVSLSSSHRIPLVRGKLGRESQTTIYHTPVRNGMQKHFRSPRDNRAESHANCQLMLEGSSTISALSDNWNFLEINCKHSDYRKCYCAWIDYRLNKTFHLHLKVWLQYGPSSPWGPEGLSSSLGWLSFIHRHRLFILGISASQTWTMTYIYFNICIIIPINM